jgi:uncharacterized protein (TIGR00266 family)
MPAFVVGQKMPVGAIALGPQEELNVDPGKMQATKGVSMVTQVAAGFFESVKSVFWGGRSLFENRFRANGNGGWILIEEGVPGQVAVIDLTRGETLKIRKDRWVASSPSVELQTNYEGFASWLFHGTGLAMIYAIANAAGKVFFRTDAGTVKAIAVDSSVDGPVTVDNNCILAYTSGLEVTTRQSGDITSLIFGAEGLVCEFSGKGTVYIASEPQDKRRVQVVHHHHHEPRPQQPARPATPLIRVNL